MAKFLSLRIVALATFVLLAAHTVAFAGNSGGGSGHSSNAGKAGGNNATAATSGKTGKKDPATSIRSQAPVNPVKNSDEARTTSAAASPNLKKLPGKKKPPTLTLKSGKSAD